MALSSQDCNRLSTALTELEQEALEATTLLPFLNSVLGRITQVLNVDYAEVLEIEGEYQVLVQHTGADWGDNATEPIRIEPGSQSEYLLQSWKPVVIENWETETRFLPLQRLQEHSVISSLSVLIQGHPQPYGILGAHATVRHHFTADEVLFLQAIAGIIAATRQRLQAAIVHQRLTSEITALQRIEVLLRQSEERYALIANASNDGIWDWNLETNEVYFSSRWKAMLGYQDDEIGTHLDDWFDRLHPDDRDLVRQEVTRHCEGLTACFESQYRLLHRDGTYRWMLSRGLAIRSAVGNIHRLIGSQTDITARKVGEEQLRYNALHDGLTGLANRTLFMERLEHAIALAKRHENYDFAVVFLDLDRFKVINDSLGHMVGDQLLVTIAHRLKGCLRSSDTCARLGGDEFAILLEYPQGSSEAIRVVERMQQMLKTPFNLNGQEVFANASIGLILSAMNYNQPEDLIRDADTAMYRAKALGRGRYEVFTQEMHEHAVSLLQLEMDLRKAIEHQEFVVFYQPVIELRTGKVTGFEALVRWQHPERGLISPAEFIPVAEETGLILSIGRWVLYESCRQMKQWQQQQPTNPPLTISVNISRKQFSQPDLIQQIETILNETGLDPQCLKLEITESAIMEDAGSATNLMQQIKTLGVQLVMDDFGTGYSSLSHLHLFPIDTLKIDPSFVHKADTDLEKVEIIRTVISLAWNLGIDVVAEGIETKRQMSQLKLLKCDLAQGYLFSKPLTQEAATSFLEQGNAFFDTKQ